jgi:hypothetical protein
MHLRLTGILMLAAGCAGTPSHADRASPARSDAGINMKKELLELTVECADGGCKYVRGEHVFLTYRLTNRHGGEIAIEFPLLEQRGPGITLIDTRTGKTNGLPPNMMNEALVGRFVRIAPGESVGATWPILPYELESFGPDGVDVTAEVTTSVRIRVGDVENMFEGKGRVRIVEARRPR